jgi:UMF1 family MFS transporter
MLKVLFKKDVFSWSLYDWANSTFSTSVMSVLFPMFFKNYWNAGVESSVSTARLGLMVGVTSAVVALLAPFLGALADEVGAKKKFLFFALLLGVLSTIGLAFVGPGLWITAALFYLVATVGFSVSLIFYDSLLLGVTDHDNIDFVSGAGYALGYLGGGLLLAVNVFMLLKPETFGLANSTAATKASFVTVGVWWFVFSLPMLFFVKEPFTKRERPLLQIVVSAFKELKQTVLKLITMKNVFYFILAYWFYIDVVYSIIKMAMDYGMSLGLAQNDLISAFLIVQFVGFPSAMLFGYLGQKWDLKKSILIGVGFYVVVVIMAFQVQNAADFRNMAILVGLVQGGVQALSRSFFARIIPSDHAAEFFGFFNLVGKAASVLGPPLFGVATYITGDNRFGVASLLFLLMMGGGILLFMVKNPARSSGSP